MAAKQPQSPSGDSPSESRDPTTRPPNVRHLSSGHSSPHRHHHRTVSATREIKETRNARSEYTNSEDDGASQRRINQYLIQQEIGRGSFGSVHLATDQFGTEYAVKEFSKHRLRRRAKSNMLRQARHQHQRPSLAGVPTISGLSTAGTLPSRSGRAMGGEDSSFDLIREEIAIMKKLNHENLVSLIEVLDDPEEDSLYMVLEMCKKGVVMRVDIDSPVTPYDDENCRLWFRDLILGIEYLHAQGIVHRDIKPDNCLLTDTDTLKLVDFGVSEMFEKGSDMKIAKSAGSPAFMAPELCIIQKEPVYGKPADIWSMGVTLFCLRFGHVPFQKSNMLDLYDSIVKDELVIPDSSSPELTDLLKRVLEKDPEQRIDMEDLRIHPWVTKNGEDLLLPSVENCSTLVDPPTEADMNTAITGNMGGLIAVLKAANKFKHGLERHHPELVENILGRAAQMTIPPLTMQNLHQKGSDIKGRIHRHLSRTDAPEDDHHAVGAAVGGSGIYRQEDVHKELGHLSRKFKNAAIKPHGYILKHTKTMPTEEPTPEEEDFQPGSFAKRRAHTYDETIRGHAHDPTKDIIFIDIGPGPFDGLDEEQQGVGDRVHETHYIVSESPPPTDGPVFETAYQKEVESIKKSGRGATIYLTRRVEHQYPEHSDTERKSLWGKVLSHSSSSPSPPKLSTSSDSNLPIKENVTSSDTMDSSEASTTENDTTAPAQTPEKQDSVKSKLGNAVGRAMTAGGQKLQQKFGHSSG